MKISDFIEKLKRNQSRTKSVWLLFLHPGAKAPLDGQMVVFVLRFSGDDLKETTNTL